MADQTHAHDILPEGSDPREPSSRATPAQPATAVKDYDVAIVGASLAGCATAIMLARTGARVALVEKSPDPKAFKRICTHYIQSSAVPTLERLGLLEPMMRAGALRAHARIWTRWGWIAPSANTTAPTGVNLRREKLDPLIREMAAQTPGVDLMLGHTVQELLRDGERFTGVRAHDSHLHAVELRARLVVGADGRDSKIAKLSGVRTKTAPHGRIAYGGYYEGPTPVTAPDAALWLLDPDMAAAFPTDGGLTFYATMPSKARLPEFRADPQGALERLVSSIPEAPPIAQSRLVGQVQGKIDMTNVLHTPTAPGLALVGDAAGAIDPLFGVGCGFALQTSEWLADSVSPALKGSESLEKGLKRYRRRHARGLGGHTRVIVDYATGRKLNGGERMLFAAAANDERTARVFEAFGSRNIGPLRMFATGIPLAMVANARRSLSRRIRPNSAKEVLVQGP
ncbi:MAG TPA: NAD(P)/FAD-dependent oxidoreductase [Solirubrobacteraceae bacterium]|jgi:2-polyprenyl-6-methoxyphenol hydroxylase-like FAD-dependent oxidoreductase